MGVGWELYGQPKGYTQEQWDALPQRDKDYIKALAPNAARDYNARMLSQNQAILAEQGAIWGPGGFPVAGPQPAPEYEYEGSYYDDDGRSGPAPAPPRQLANSPEWLAYLQALGLEEGQFRADIDRQRSMAKAAADYQAAGIGPEYDKQRRGISSSMEARGLQSSGEKLRRLAESRADEGRAQAGVQLGLGQTLSQLESSLANKMMDLGARRASQELSMRAGGYV